MNKKLLWTTAGLLPLVAAPVAIVASCSTTVSAAKAIAETLSQGENVKLKENKGTYSVSELEKFNQDPKTFMSEIDINVANKDQFNFEITEFDGYQNDSDKKVYAKIKIKVTDKNNNSDSATSSDISLAITVKGASEAVKAKVEEANKAFKDKTFKVNDKITFDAAHLKALEGYASLTAEEKSKLDATGVLKSLFTGVVEGESKKTNLLIQKFEVTKAATFAGSAAAAKPKFTITLQLAYEDVAGDKTRALTDEASFEIEYDATAKAATIVKVLESLNTNKWFKLKEESYKDKEITNATVLDKTKTNFEDLKAKFLPEDFTYSVEQADFNEKEEKGKTKVTFAITAKKDSDTSKMTKSIELTYTKKTGN